MSKNPQNIEHYFYLIKERRKKFVVICLVGFLTVGLLSIFFHLTTHKHILLKSYQSSSLLNEYFFEEKLLLKLNQPVFIDYLR